MSSPTRTIAIDGPAGAGKSTVAALLAARLGLRILDTGAMYRCVALQAVHAGTRDPEVAEALARDQVVSFAPGNPQRVLMNGEDVTEQIRTLEIGRLASDLSTHGPLRKVLVARQQAMAAAGGWVLEGRDVTTVVAPNADLKIFLTASIEERGRRRWKEITDRGETRSLQEVVRDVVRRDHQDYTRTESPLQLAEDAVIVESFGLTPEGVVDRIVTLLR